MTVDGGENESAMASFDSEFSVCYTSKASNCERFFGNCVSMYIKLMMIIECLCLDGFEMRNAAKTVNPWKSKDILCFWLRLMKIEPLAGVFICDSKGIVNAISRRCECCESRL